jgi:hypothetical protein
VLLLPLGLFGLAAAWFFLSDSGVPWAVRRALDSAGLGDIRFSRAHFADGSIVIEGIETDGAADLRIARLEASIDGEGLRARRLSRLALSGVRGTITLGGGPAGSFALPPVDAAMIEDIDVTIRSGDFAVALRGAIDARQTPQAFVITTRDLRLASLADPAWFTPLRLAAEARIAAPTAPIAIAVNGTDETGAFAFEVAGPFAIGSGETRLQAKIFPLTLVPDVRPIESLFPIARRFVESLSGTLSGDFTIIGRAGDDGSTQWSGQGASTLRQVDVTAQGFTFEGIDAALTFSQLFPPTLREEQSVTVRRAALALPLDDIRLRFTLSPKRLSLRAFEAELADGSVRAAPLAITLGAPVIDTVLTIEGVSLAALIAIAEIDGLSGEGLLDGTLPITLREGKLAISGGVLAARGEGVLRYRPTEEAGAQSASAEMAMVRQVLTDFRYKELKMQVDGAVGEEQTVVVRLVGANPEFYNGYPVAFTLNLSGALEAIVRRGVTAYTIPDTLRTNIERLQKENRR